MFDTKYIKLLTLALGVAVVNIAVFSPGFIGLNMGASALAGALGATLLLASALILVYFIYALMIKAPPVFPVKLIQTHDDYVEALLSYKHVKSLEEDISFALSQLERMKKKKETLYEILQQRFEPEELSYKKFSSVIQEVERLFYLNLKSILNRLSVFDESELESIAGANARRLSANLLQEKKRIYEDYLIFTKDSLATNEEMLLKFDKLILEISRLDSFEAGEIEQMPCMQEIDSLIKQTKLYKN